MRNRLGRVGNGWLLAAASGLLWLLCGCDPTIKATAENGLITVSQSFLTAFLQAAVQAAATKPTG